MTYACVPVRKGVWCETRFRPRRISMRVLKGRSILLLVLFLTASVLSHGQGGPTSTLSGVVSDQSGAVIPGADVTAKNVATAQEFKTVTVENGTYSIPALDPGVYTVTVSLPGFKVALVTNVKI